MVGEKEGGQSQDPQAYIRGPGYLSSAASDWCTARNSSQRGIYEIGLTKGKHGRPLRDKMGEEKEEKKSATTV